MFIITLLSLFMLAFFSPVYSMNNCPNNQNYDAETSSEEDSDKEAVEAPRRRRVPSRATSNVEITTTQGPFHNEQRPDVRRVNWHTTGDRPDETPLYMQAASSTGTSSVTTTTTPSKGRIKNVAQVIEKKSPSKKHEEIHAQALRGETLLGGEKKCKEQEKRASMPTQQKEKTTKKARTTTTTTTITATTTDTTGPNSAASHQDAAEALATLSQENQQQDNQQQNASVMIIGVTTRAKRAKWNHINNKINQDKEKRKK